ncbi:MAG: ECF transporter S component [Desulfurococcaceae archaeon]
MPRLSAREVVLAAVFTVMTYAATVALQIYQPVTGGYFNLGEAVIYLAALTASPLVAAVAGGVGASLADLSTGYAIFAPATLVIKFVEGYAAGWLVRKLRRGERGYVAAVGGLYFAVGAYYAAAYWSGGIEVGPSAWGITAFADVPLWIWLLAVLALSFAIAYAILRALVRGGEAIAVLLAGMLMVLGYFLYEYFVSNPLTGRPPINALYEVPVNIGQAVAGALIAVPLAAWLRRAGYSSG